MRETIELFGQTLRYVDQLSGRDILVWEGPTFGLAISRHFDDGDEAEWTLSVDNGDLYYAVHGHATVAEAAQHLATNLMDEIEDRAQVARRLLAEVSVELKGGEA